MGRRVGMYFAWDRPREIVAPLDVLEDRFPALFEIRRLYYPSFEALADGKSFDQGIDGFIDHIFLSNYTTFAEQTTSLCGVPVKMLQRQTAAGRAPLTNELLTDFDTLIIISFDTHVTGVRPQPEEIATITQFIRDPAHTLFVCPHHNIGDVEDLPTSEQQNRQIAEFYHHGDRAIPARQRLGGFAVELLKGLGLPIQNRYGLRPARDSHGQPAPLILAGTDRYGLFDGVATLNLHPHLPHFERLDGSHSKFDVLVRQAIDPDAPPHPCMSGKRRDFDAVLQAQPDVVAGSLLVADSTLWSSTAGGLEGLQRFWRNVALQTS